MLSTIYLVLFQQQQQQQLCMARGSPKRLHFTPVLCPLHSIEIICGLQSELEDLCFAVLHPGCYRKLHAERNQLWQRNVVSPSIAEEADRALGSCSTCGAVQPETHQPAEATTSGSVQVSKIKQPKKGSTEVQVSDVKLTKPQLIEGKHMFGQR